MSGGQGRSGSMDGSRLGLSIGYNRAGSRFRSLDMPRKPVARHFRQTDARYDSCQGSRGRPQGG